MRRAGGLQPPARLPPAPRRRPKRLSRRILQLPIGGWRRVECRPAPPGVGGVQGRNTFCKSGRSERSRRMTARLVAGGVLVMAMALAGGCRAKEGQKVVG